jgi:ATP-dependent RNA helicase DDX41
VNVGRAGAASMDVFQEVEYVKEENKLLYLLECLQKTPPPVLVFCENKSDVDAIQEYLLLKGVEAAATHGSKGIHSRSVVVCHAYYCLEDQEEREQAIKTFKNGVADVMVATDLASKGLDFPDIKHVINYDMPEDIENYGTVNHPLCKATLSRPQCIVSGVRAVAARPAMPPPSSTSARPRKRCLI